MDKRTFIINAILFRQGKVTQEFLHTQTESEANLVEGNDVGEVRAKLVHALFELDYVLSEEIYNAIKGLTEEQLTEVHNKLIKLTSLVKGDVSGEVFYPNFPKFVKSLTQEELDYFRGMHYLYNGVGDITGNINFNYVPSQFLEVEESELPDILGKITEVLNSEEGYSKLLEEYPNKKVIEFGTEEEAIDYVRGVINSKASVSQDMIKVLDIILELDQEEIEEILPEKITRKEIMAHVVSHLVGKEDSLEPFKKYIETTTDVLRVLDVLNGGDGSLKTFKYQKMSRGVRRFILTLLDTLSPYTVSEDMFRNESVWKGLLKVLHPFEKRYNGFENAQHAFKLFVSGDKSHTFNHKLEKAITQLKEEGKVDGVLTELSKRPGEFARRLDLVLRESSEGESYKVLEDFNKVVTEVSSLILYQMKTHFDNYGTQITFVEVKNGMFAREVERPINDFSVYIIKGIIDTEIKRRMSELEPLGKVFLDTKLKQLKMPLSLRTSSVNNSRVITRGSRIPLSKKENIRLFTHWKNNVSEQGGSGEYRADVDLSVALLDEDKNLKDRVAYYHQRVSGLKSLVFSGDMVNAPRPKGANEFIDFNKEELKQAGIRYVTMSLILFSSGDGMRNTTFKGLEEVTAGWVEFDVGTEGIVRHNSQVKFNIEETKNQFDVISDSTSSVPLVIDLYRDEMIWLDVFKPSKDFHSRVDDASKFIKDAIDYYSTNQTMTIYELLDTHIKCRNGTEVYNKEDADTVFDLDTVSLPDILSDYL